MLKERFDIVELEYLSYLVDKQLFENNKYNVGSSAKRNTEKLSKKIKRMIDNEKYLSGMIKDCENARV